jgi:glycosyltransferase involved in cell wall biosynthesis
MKNLSVVLAVYNEESNLKECLDSVRDIADEIVIVDGGSSDKTVEIAESFGAKVIRTDNPPIFHINKQKALDAASCEWILQLDADERVSKELAKEIKKIVDGNAEAVDNHQVNPEQYELLMRHLSLLEARDGKIGNGGAIAAFYMPRRNYFLGKFLKFGGTYPDGTVRLVRKGRAHFALKDVHDQMIIDGGVSILSNDLIHMADPTFSRYLKRSDRYTTLQAEEWINNFKKVSGAKSNFAPGVGIFSIIKWIFIEPNKVFVSLYFRHKGMLDGMPGLVWAIYSSLHIRTSYIKYWEMKKKDR